MKIRYYLLVTLVPLLLLADTKPCRAQQSKPDGTTDYQLRILLHKQLPISKGVGVAGWMIVPDATQTNPLRVVAVGGLLLKSERRWLEIMGGVMVKTDGTSNPLLDIRYIDKPTRRVEVFAEALYNFTTKRLLLDPNVTTPVHLGKFKFAVGAEMDAFIGGVQPNSIAYGPRIAIPLPLCKRVCKNASLATAYQFNAPSGRVLRQYLVINF